MAGREKRSRKYISYKIDATYLQDRFLHSSSRSKRPELLSTFVRIFNHLRFLFFCSASLVHALAPWMLSFIEVLTVLLVFFLAIARTAVSRQPPAPYHFLYKHSVVDIVGLACTRAALLSIAYAVGLRMGHRPYMYMAYFLAAACFPYIFVKTILYKYTQDAVPAAALFAITSTFCWLHVLAGRRTVDWARRRYVMGLGGVGVPWDEQEESWQLRRSNLEDLTKCSDGGGEGDEDVAPESMADGDSKFVEVGGMRVHYKEGAAAAVVLAGGPRGHRGRHRGRAGAWLQCRVVAFDRPAFGLTSRPRVVDDLHNPYSVGSQAALTLQLCAALGLHRVVLIAHSDGCLLALRAAALAVSNAEELTKLQPPASANHQMSHSSGGNGGPRSSSSSANLHGPATLSASQWLPSNDLAHAPILQQSAAAGLLAHEHHPSFSQPACGNGSNSSTPRLANSPVTLSATNSVNLQDPGAAPQHPHPHQQQQPPSQSQQLHAPALHATSGALHYPQQQQQQQQFVSQESGPNHVGLVIPPRGSGRSSNDTSAGSSLNGGNGAGCVGGRSYSAAGSADVEVGSIRDTLLDLEPASGLLGSLHLLQQSLNNSNSHQHTSRRPTSLEHVLGISSDHSGLPPIPSSHRPRSHHQRHNSNPNVSYSRHRGSRSESSCGPAVLCMPIVLGVVLLHPNLSGVMGPAFSRLLARSKLGRSILRPLLRTEIGEVANRRAWHDTVKLTSEVLELYKAPLRVEGWDSALIETTRLRREFSQLELTSYFSSLRPLPALVVTGEHDRIMPPLKAESLCSDLPECRLSVLSDCGHLSHEEAPAALLEQLVPFVGELLLQPSLAPAHMPPPAA
ncbi:MAG: hypothetical protein WDW38_011055 [Sanguina aurantia]